MKDNTSLLMKIVIGFIGAVAVFALVTFLAGGGAQVLGHEGAGFWISLVLFVAFAVLAGWLGYRRYTRTQDGIDTVPYLIVVAILLGIAFGKGCTDKANDGVTTAKGRVIKG